MGTGTPAAGTQTPSNIAAATILQTKRTMGPGFIANCILPVPPQNGKGREFSCLLRASGEYGNE
jgi:hypothetical protein